MDLAEGDQQWAGHYLGGGSDKVWGACLQALTVTSAWGRRGAALQRGEKAFATAEAAAKFYAKKVQDKVLEGYQPIPFDDARYGVPAFLPLTPVAGQDGAASTTITTAITPRASTYTPSHVLPLAPEELHALLASPDHGIAEKVNGERCLIASDGADLRAYNRKGQLATTVPQGALPLGRLGHPFVIDGERLTGELGGHYVAFDLLEWQGRDVRPWPFARRIAALAAAVRALDLAATVGASLLTADPEDDARRTALPALHLLVPEVDEAIGARTLATLQARNGEGIVVRTMHAPYEEGDARNVRKHKFQAEVDAIVVRVNPGVATGSVTLGLVRRSDGAIIEVGNVRSGLTDPDILALEAMLARGERPVLAVGYLPARTVGLKLVEPRTGMLKLRTDKLAEECGTDQLGAEKATLVALARGMRL